VDVIRFQHFVPIHEVAESFEHWHGIKGLPVLLAGAAPKYESHDLAEHYGERIRALRELPCCVG